MYLEFERPIMFTGKNKKIAVNSKENTKKKWNTFRLRMVQTKQKREKKMMKFAKYLYWGEAYKRVIN